MKEFLFFGPIYGFAFLAMFAIRRARWLALALPGALIVTLAIVHFGTMGQGEAGLFLYLVGLVAALGFVAGGAGRAAVILIRQRTQRVPSEAVALLFLLGAPLVVKLWTEARENEHRRRYAPPSEQCKARLHDAVLGDRTVRLPLIPGITLQRAGRGERQVSFYIQERAREFCESTEAGKPRLAMVRIDFPQLPTRPEARQRPMCDAPRKEPWWPALCRHEAPEQTDLYSLALFDPARFDAETYLSLQVEPAGRDRAQYDQRWTRVGPFFRATVDQYTYWRASTWPGAASAYVARCYESTDLENKPNGLRCHAGYRLSPGVGLVYDFQVLDGRFVPEAIRQDKRVAAIARSLLAAHGAVPSRP